MNSDEQNQIQNPTYDGSIYREVNALHFEETNELEQHGGEEVEIQNEVVLESIVDVTMAQPLSKKWVRRKRRLQGTCEICNKHFACLKRHMRVHTDRSRIYVCDVCGKAFYTKQILKKHEEVHTVGREHGCTTCGRKFPTPRLLKIHVDRVHSVQRLACPTCSKVFRCKVYLQRHLRSHDPSRQHRCEVCGKGFIFRRELAQHALIHTGERPFKCDKCNKTFRLKHILNSHLRRVHSNKPKTLDFVCEICGHMTYELRTMKMHIRSVHGERKRKYQCSQCGRRFRERSTLKLHISTHEKKYKCDLCGSRFSQPSYLQTHIRKYEGRKPFDCGHCGKQFHERDHASHHIIMNHVISEKRREELSKNKPQINIEVIPEEDNEMERFEFPVSDEALTKMRKDISNNWDLNLSKILSNITREAAEDMEHTDSDSDFEFGISVRKLQEMKQEISTNWDTNLKNFIDEIPDGLELELSEDENSSEIDGEDSLRTNDTLAYFNALLNIEIESHNTQQTESDLQTTAVKDTVERDGPLVLNGYFEAHRTNSLQDYSSSHDGYIDIHQISSNGEAVTAPVGSHSQARLLTNHTLTIGGNTEVITPSSGENNVRFDQRNELIVAGMTPNNSTMQNTLNLGSAKESYTLAPVALGALSNIRQPTMVPKTAIMDGRLIAHGPSVVQNLTSAVETPVQSVAQFSIVSADALNQNGDYGDKAMSETTLPYVREELHDAMDESTAVENWGSLDKNVESPHDNDQKPARKWKKKNLKEKKCETCGKSVKHMKQHMRVHTLEKEFECDACGEKFRHYVSMVTHKAREHEGKRPYQCKVCQKEYWGKKSLDDHMFTHGGTKPYMCEICGRGFVRRYNLKNHMRVHTNTRPFVCQYCGSAFTVNSVLKEHIRLHTGERPFPCDVCGMRFRQASSRNYHKARRHATVKPFKCDQCNFSAATQGLLTRHVRAHNAPRVSYKCDICNVDCASRFSLKRHKITHGAYSCKDCGADFNSQEKYEHHMKTYGDSPVMSCGECGKTFHSRHSMIRHVKLHVGQNKFSNTCCICRRNFVTKSKLHLHLKKYEGQKPFKCGHCGKYYHDADKAKLHVASHLTKKEEK